MIRGLIRGLREHGPDGGGLFVPEIHHRIPDLHLTTMVGTSGEGHERFERHAIHNRYLEEGRDQGGDLQALLDDLRRHDEGCRNRFLALAFCV